MRIKALFLLLPILFMFACKKKDVPTETDVCAGIIREPKKVTIPKGAVNRKGRGSIWYEPPVLEIGVCDTIVWENKDTIWHTATADVEAIVLFNTGYLAAGATSQQIKFKKPGQYPYHCAPHPYMKGKVVVK